MADENQIVVPTARGNRPKNEETKPERQSGEMQELLKILLQEKAQEAKEKQEKKDKEAEERRRKIEAEVEAAKAQEEQKRLRRESCPHQQIHPATKQRTPAWRAQVNSDGYFTPVCCLCLTEMPKIKASEHHIREGVQLDKYAELPVKALETWHRQSFPGGCDRDTCYICHPIAEVVA